MSRWTERTWYVDLSAGRTWYEDRKYDEVAQVIGGSGQGWALMAERLPAGIDPLSPKNVIILNPGVFVGTAAIGSPKLTAITKFPTHASADHKHFVGSCTGGGRYFAIGMRQAGCDRLVIEGKAETPVIIAIRDGGVTVEPADDLWGHGIEDVSKELIQREGPDTGVLVIGTGGEKLVRSALSFIDRTNSLGRGGLGAVFGSKNVKAVIAHGTGSIRVADPDKYVEISKALTSRVLDWPRRSHWIKLGLAAGWSTFRHTQNPGIWPKADWDKLYGEEKRLQSLQSVIACVSCPLSCRLRWKLPGGEFSGEQGLGSPYSKSATSGQLLGIKDDRLMIHLVTEANSITGIDFYTTTRLIDFVTQMYERGRISTEQVGFELHRDYKTYAKLYRMTADREGIGDILADGWFRVQEDLGLDPREYWYAGVCKGIDFIYDARPSRFHPLMMSFLTRPRPHHGGSHTRTNSRNKTLEEIREQVEHWQLDEATMNRIFTETDYSGKFNVGRYTAYMEDLMRVKNALGLCSMYTYQGLIFADDMAQLYSAAVGEEVTARDLVLRGERVSNVAKMINVREGFSRADDQPPDAWFRPMDAPEGRIEIEDYFQTKVLNRDDLARMLDDYYEERGWDIPTGQPTHEKLAALGLKAYAET